VCELFGVVRYKNPNFDLISIIRTRCYDLDTLTFSILFSSPPSEIRILSLFVSKGHVGM